MRSIHVGWMEQPRTPLQRVLQGLEGQWRWREEGWGLWGAGGREKVGCTGGQPTHVQGWRPGWEGKLKGLVWSE